MVVSVTGKGGTQSRQVRSRKTSESEPSMTRRNRIIDVRTGGGADPGTSMGGDLKPGTGGIRPEGFAGSDEGGRRAAIYTLIETAKLNDIDPKAWLADVRD
jgi:hypothetical protein